jgi:DNA-binding transcriptional ArsR family regulator
MRTVEETMDALADDRRRELLAYLLERDDDEKVEVAALVDHLSDGGEDVDHERIHTRLRHVDLPRLADAGIVSYERSAETVRLADDASLIEDALDAVDTFRE